jgi:hypothetical protein
MPKLICTEPVCRHEWTEATDPTQPRCPRCGGFWVRVVPDEPSADRARTAGSRARGRMLARRTTATTRR